MSRSPKPVIRVELQPPLDRRASERLLQFCLDSGVDCFSTTLVYWEERQLRRADAEFFDRVAPLSLGCRSLERIVIPAEGAVFVPQECWRFNAESMRLILQACGGSLTTYDASRYPEDWTFYRRDQLFLGIVSHETNAFMRLTKEDLERFKLVGLPHSPKR